MYIILIHFIIKIGICEIITNSAYTTYITKTVIIHHIIIILNRNLVLI